MKPTDLFKISGMKNSFLENHPKFPKFIKKLQQVGIRQDDIIAITVKKMDGQVIETNMKITASDEELMAQIISMTNKSK